jgi:predicted DCC family thiol-disulfide oxidoreductase YuxK
MPDSPKPVLLYDGVCGLCNRAVQFILKRDTRDRFRFAALQSEFARRALQKHGLSNQSLDSLYLVLDSGLPTERVEERSTASITIGRELGGIWRVLANVVSVFPRGLRDWKYDLIARYRYRIFGKYETCPLPKASDRYKFLDQG